MSAASKSKALRPWRVRERVARELAKVIIASPHGVRAHSTRTGGFDVHAAREHARSLVALADEQAAFEDWTRAKGLGPESREPGTFALCPDCKGCRVVANIHGWMLPAGVWSGYVKRHGVDNVRSEFGADLGVEVRSGEAVECLRCSRGAPSGGWPGNLAREWARHGGDRRAPMGRSLARLGQHILDAIEGQPSECQACIDATFHEDLDKAHARTSDRTLHISNTGEHEQRESDHLQGLQDPICRERRGSRNHDSMHISPGPRGRSYVTHDQRARVSFSEGVARRYQVEDRPTSRGEFSDAKNARGAGASTGAIGPSRCPDCQGTGHNLAVYLPEPEVSPQLRRRGREAVRGADSQHRPCQQWLIDAFEAGRESGWVLTRPQATDGWGDPVHDIRTRVTPRGEHRHTGAWPSAAEAHRRAQKGSEMRLDALDSLVSERLWDCYSSPSDHSHWPTWARGEIKHAQHRREREARAYELEMSEHALALADVL